MSCRWWRCIGNKRAASKVDVPKLIRPRCRCRRCRCHLSSCPMKKSDHGAFDPKTFATAVTPNGTRVYALPVVSRTRGNSRILEAGRRRSGPAGCGSLARTQVVSLTARMRWSRFHHLLRHGRQMQAPGASQFGDGRDRHRAHCLLYTSPSPRD